MTYYIYKRSEFFNSWKPITKIDWYLHVKKISPLECFFSVIEQVEKTIIDCQMQHTFKIWKYKDFELLEIEVDNFFMIPDIYDHLEFGDYLLTNYDLFEHDR